MTKKILILNGNPKSTSFCQQLANTYIVEAREYYEVKHFNLSEMAFNPSLDSGYDAKQDLEPDLQDFQKCLLWAEHIVIFSPIWWGGLPAKLKGLFDRSFLPHFAFKYECDNPQPTPLLIGKTARIVLTMDMPEPYLEDQARPVLEQLDQYTLQFSGVEKAATNLFGSMILATQEQKQNWEKLIHSLANQGL
ncbi:NAD(P)H-dependent oxidoreductase [Pseudoalteromonas umbrosa]|uniref:NAD(P)H-dependent oxidoreductase n=1 Tax=Pseudoalteromonas umbrosa TaxID=3048489 RepID=UPI0024C2679B|nr:NAD(P)H-dependent oxidoreductase [Pseudoalteromonas sp. B95]MDK1286875.1 NAD(P)H-dependent oxidoreductase [Pseudoalteromonas sp. B95]